MVFLSICNKILNCVFCFCSKVINDRVETYVLGVVEFSGVVYAICSCAVLVVLLM